MMIHPLHPTVHWGQILQTERQTDRHADGFKAERAGRVEWLERTKQ